MPIVCYFQKQKRKKKNELSREFSFVVLKSQLDFLKVAPYSLDHDEKSARLKQFLNELTRWHYDNSAEYAAVLNALGCAPNDDAELELSELPFLPVRLFKEFELPSVPRDRIVKTMVSSGTSGQTPSKIFLDSETARAQSKCLSHIIGSFIGGKRLPLIILDSELVKKDRRMASARGAGIIGFSMFGRDVFYALDENMQLKLDELRAYIGKHRGEKIMLFGYTYMIWQYFQKELRRQNISLDIDDGILFHTGGWKKILSERVAPLEYNRILQSVCGNVTVHDYYGMTEQLGSVFVECEHGHKHCSIYSDILIRDHKDFHVREHGEIGLIELMSVLPSSYPGHIILTEDEGKILGEDDCPCGRLGKYFEILGRVKNAEARGCSDTYGR